MSGLRAKVCHLDDKVISSRMADVTFWASLSYSPSICHHWSRGHALQLPLQLNPWPCSNLVCMSIMFCLHVTRNHIILPRESVEFQVWGKFQFCAILKKRTVDYWSLLNSWMLCGCTVPIFPEDLSGWSLKQATLHLSTVLTMCNWPRGDCKHLIHYVYVICLVKEIIFILAYSKTKKNEATNDNILDWQEHRKLEPCTSLSHILLITLF